MNTTMKTLLLATLVSCGGGSKREDIQGNVGAVAATRPAMKAPLAAITIRGELLVKQMDSWLPMIEGNTLHLTNVTFLENDLQNSVSTSLLIQHYQAAGARAVKFANSRFHSIAALNSWMRIGSSTFSLDTWRTQVADVGSVRQQAAYPNPTASIGSYHASILGAPTHDAFMAEARQQSKSYWRPQYTARAANAWIRAAFGIVN